MADNTNFLHRWRTTLFNGKVHIPFTINPTYRGPEEFKVIDDSIVKGIIPDRYVISNTGYLYYNADCYENYNILHPYPDSQGYWTVALKLSNKKQKHEKIHRLVAKAFVENPDPENKKFVNHIDGVKQNAYFNNLEWVTPKENSQHASKIGLLPKLDESHALSKIPKVEVKIYIGKKKLEEEKDRSFQPDYSHMIGENNINNKLSEKEVREICELIQSGKYWDVEIANIYNVSYTNISDIHKGKIWTHISCEYDFSKRKPAKKLTPENVEEICKLLEEGELNDVKIGAKFGVSRINIAQIRKGKIWTHISCKYDLPKAKSNKR